VSPAIVRVPLRGVADGFAVAANWTSDVPLVPADKTLSQPSLVVAPQPQAEGASTRTLPEPPPAGAAPEAVSSANEQAIPACVTLIVCPAIVSAPDRWTVDAAFDATNTLIVALPLPDAGDSVAQGTLLEADHPQFAPLAVTPTEPLAVPDPYGDPRFDVFTVTLHDRASCATVNVCPPIVMVPVRGTVVEFASTA
jgi:hypothetical protein